MSPLTFVLFIVGGGLLVLGAELLVRGASQLAASLAPLVEDAITSSVHRNPQPLADALFPVMGPAIRKSIEHLLASMMEAFNRGVGAPDTFYGILADDVHWTVARAEAPSTYTSRQEFLANGSGPITSRLDGQITAEVHELIAQGDQVVARWRGRATARDGLPYVNEYNWVMTMAGGQVTRVVAYLDLVALDELLTRVPI